MQIYVYYYCNNPKQWQILSVSVANYLALSAFGEGEESSLYQLYAWPASGVWEMTYSGGNSIHINS